MRRAFLLFVCALLVSCAKPLPGTPYVDRGEHIAMDASLVPSLAGQSRPEVQSLTIGGCGRLDDLTALRGLENLTTLQLGGDACLHVYSLAGIEALPKLRRIGLKATLDDLTPLQHVPELRQLFLELPRENVTFLEGLELDDLAIDLTAAPDAELDALTKVPTLSRLSSLALTAKRLPTLPFMPHLGYLVVVLHQDKDDIRLAESIDLSFAADTPSLENLRLSGALHADLRPLLSLRALKQLEVAGICEVDPDVLVRLPKVRSYSVFARLDERVFPNRPGIYVGRANWGPCARKAVAPLLVVPAR